MKNKKRLFLLLAVVLVMAGCAGEADNASFMEWWHSTPSNGDVVVMAVIAALIIK